MPRLDWLKRLAKLCRSFENISFKVVASIEIVWRKSLVTCCGVSR